MAWQLVETSGRHYVGDWDFGGFLLEQSRNLIIKWCVLLLNFCSSVVQSSIQELYFSREVKFLKVGLAIGLFSVKKKFALSLRWNILFQPWRLYFAKLKLDKTYSMQSGCCDYFVKSIFLKFLRLLYLKDIRGREISLYKGKWNCQGRLGYMWFSLDFLIKLRDY